MAANVTVWQQDALFNPLNPNQKSYTYYTGIPGGYGSFYYSKVGTIPLKGPPAGVRFLGALGLTSLPDWATAGLVGLAGVAIGFAGMKFGAPRVKRFLRRRR